MSELLDLGEGHSLRFVAFKPDRNLNPQLAHMPDDERCGAVIEHLNKSGIPCVGGYVGFNPALNTATACWRVESWEPLTLSPSVLCTVCGDHGFVRGGKWVAA